MPNKTIQDLLKFLDSSPTAWHAVDSMKERLVAAGYQELSESESWKIVAGGRYYIVRQGSSLCAFQVPAETPIKAHIIGSHTDSPSFKLKPHAEFMRDEMCMLGVEVYGSPLLSSWLNRDLGIAGKVFYLDQKGNRKEALVRLDEHPVVIPQLALHLDRTVNDQGPKLNKQEHLSALIGMRELSLQDLLKKQLKAQTILSSELFLFPVQPAAVIGFDNEFISAYRLDNLESVHASLNALIDHKKPHKNTLRCAIFWDHEEVGSGSSHGASSTFLPQVLERIFISLGHKREDYLRFISESFCISVDLAHAVHPGHAEKHDPQHRPMLGKGIVIKSNAQQRYATSAHSMATIVELCLKNRIPFQHFASRNDMPCGSTIGPLTATAMGISTVDIGCPQLSMHASREIVSSQDHLHLCTLLSAYFE